MALPKDAQFLIVPDSFKGTLASPEVAQAIAAGIIKALPEARCRTFPMADGGEGSSEIAGRACGASRVEMKVCGPSGETVSAFYFIKDDRAFIELAAASGLPLLVNKAEHAERATSFGTGELIGNAIERGAKEIFVFLGGSATSDAGVGIASALGVNFKSHDERALFATHTPAAEDSISDISRIDATDAATLLEGVQIYAVVDVQNPLFGPNGAAHIYGPQKGLNPEAVEHVNKSHQKLASTVAEQLQFKDSQAPGMGAAGGASFGLCAFLGGSLISGPEFFLDLINFKEEIKQADVVISGEGKVDSQSINGKLLKELLTQCENTETPLWALAGVCDLTAEDIQAYSQLKVFGLGHSQALENPALALTLLTGQLVSLAAA